MDREYYGVHYTEDDFRLEQCYSLLLETYEEKANVLYEAVETYLFQDIYPSIVGTNIEAAQWIVKLGRQPELRLSKSHFKQLKDSVSNPIIHKYIYFYDLCHVISALQDRLESIVYYMKILYERVPSTEHYKDSDYDGAKRYYGSDETMTHTVLNSIFVALASVLDLMSKIANEQYTVNSYDFTKYSKMNSCNVTFNTSNPAKGVDPSLVAHDKLFMAAKDLTMVEVFRNDYVHNGSWDLRTGVYVGRYKGVPSDVFICCPDITDNGGFETCGSRNKFYSQGAKINVLLPDIVLSVVTKVKNSIDQIVVLYQQSTNPNPKQQLTIDCIKDIEATWPLFTSLFTKQ